MIATIVQLIPIISYRYKKKKEEKILLVMRMLQIYSLNHFPLHQAVV